MNHITADFLDMLTERAAANPRRRQHYNLHASSDEPCQRLLNAVWPDSYIRPHRHASYTTNESLLALRGTFALIEFLDAGEVDAIYLFGEQANTAIVEVPPDRWHTVLALTDEAILFETKSGPFNSDAAKGFADWAPLEGTDEQAEYLKALHQIVAQEVARSASDFRPERADMFVEAAGRGDHEAVSRAINAGAPVDARVKSGWTSLIAAARSGRAEVVRLLIAAGADVNLPNPNGTTPLMYAKTHAFASGDTTVMSLLLKAGADINACDGRGWTVLDYVETRQEMLVRYLCGHGARSLRDS